MTKANLSIKPFIICMLLLTILILSCKTSKQTTIVNDPETGIKNINSSKLAESPVLKREILSLMDESHKYNNEDFDILKKIQLVKLTFKNNLTVFLLEDHKAPVFTYNTFYNVGALNEPKKQKGIAHLFEHMMFRVFNRDDHIKYKLENGEYWKLIRQEGAVKINATTWKDRTNYYASLPSDKLEFTIRMESTRMRYLVLNSEMLETEKNAVFTEFSRMMDVPGNSMYFWLWPLAFNSHPYGSDTIGNIEDLTNITVENCKSFYNTYYSPANAAIFVVGDIKEDKLIKLIDKYYGSFPKIDIPKQDIPPEQPLSESLYKEVHHNTDVERILIGYRIPGSKESENIKYNTTIKDKTKNQPFTREDLTALQLLGMLIGGSETSDMELLLLKKKKVRSYYQWTNTFKHPCLWILYSEASTGTTAKELLETIDKIIDKRSSELILKDELQRIVNTILLGSYGMLNKYNSMAYIFGESYIASGGDPLYALRDLMAYSKITPEKLKEVARKYLTKDKRIVLVQKPGTPEHSGWFKDISKRTK